MIFFFSGMLFSPMVSFSAAVYHALKWLNGVYLLENELLAFFRIKFLKIVIFLRMCFTNIFRKPGFEEVFLVQLTHFVVCAINLVHLSRYV